MFYLDPLRIIALEAAAVIAAAHIADVTTNPHDVDLANLGSGTFAELGALVTDETLVSSGNIVNADIDAAAAIVESKLNLNFATHSNALDHANTNDPTADEKAALVGTDGSPGAANKYVTDSDPRLGTTTVVKVLGTVSTVNMFAASNPLLFSVTSGKTAVVTSIIIKVTTAPGSVSTIPEAGIEIGAAAGTFDIISKQALIGLGVSTEAFMLTPAGGGFRLADSLEEIYLNVGTSGIGTGTFECQVDLLGYEY